MLALLNDIDVVASNIDNAYLNDPCRERIRAKAGPEFGSQKGCVMLMVRALYGLNSRGASWRAMLVETLDKDCVGYISTDSDT